MAPETRTWIRFGQYLVYKRLVQAHTKAKVRGAGDALLSWDPSIFTLRRSQRARKAAIVKALFAVANTKFCAKLALV